MALAGVAKFVEVSFCNQNVAGSITRQGTYLGCGLDPQLRSLVWALDPSARALGGN